jgi:hypothetical protein
MFTDLFKIVRTATLAAVVGIWVIAWTVPYARAQHAVKDGDMTVTFNLENLPLPRQPTATFTQTFALSKAKPQVTTAAINERDRAGIASQRVCPVTGAGLDSMGGPIKVLVGDQPVYLCCRGCVSKVVNAPETYLAKAKKSSQGR